jgi:NADH dehydrogenase
MKIVIIGGGFGGVNLALTLANEKNCEVVLVDKNNYKFFPPLIYQVGTAFLDPSSISYPFRKLFAHCSNIKFRLGEFLEVFPEENKIRLSNGELEYDQLVFATGCETNYFGMKNVEENAIAMKTLEDALEMRNRLIQQMENASIGQDPEEVKKALTVVIAGGGATGVELSGIFAEMRNGILRKEYPELIGKGSTIYLVHGGAALLGPMSEASQQETYKALDKLGVKIKLKSYVKDYIDDKVILDTGEVIYSKTLIWAAGVSATKFPGIPEACYGRGKRLLVDEFNKVNDTKNIYAIGDTCLQLHETAFAEGHPQMAQPAIQQGILLAQNFKRMTKNQPLKPFKYVDKGSMAIIGKNKAVVDMENPKLHFKGFIAWLAWAFIHLVSLITFKNKVKTLFNWLIAYCTNDQSLRMIIKASGKKNKTEETSLGVDTK